MRHALFIVGAGHLCKTRSCAGSILSKKMPDATYSIFQHCPRVDNTHSIPERIRHGMFDYAFYKSGDHPIAFELKYSPFGKEPFDGLYYEGSGTYQDNYDGYLFLGSLDKEPNGEILMDLFNESFINEMDRRYHLIGTSLVKDWGLKEFSRNAVIDELKAEDAKLKWRSVITPLIDGKTKE
jgi:hypothetical protein